MSEPVPPSPFAPPPQVPPQPFTPGVRPAGTGGCGKAAMIGCGVLLLLLGIAAIVFVTRAKDLLTWSMTRMKDEIVRKLPAEVTADDRARLDRAFDAAASKATRGEVDPAALQRLQRELLSVAQEPLTRERVLELTRSLEEIGGIAAPAPGEPGEAAPGEESTDGTPPAEAPDPDGDAPVAAPAAPQPRAPLAALVRAPLAAAA